jgi:hypothetical protein
LEPITGDKTSLMMPFLTNTKIAKLEALVAHLHNLQKEKNRIFSAIVEFFSYPFLHIAKCKMPDLLMELTGK